MALQTRGKGAGGAITNIVGKNFEDRTDMTSSLCQKGYVPFKFTKEKWTFYKLREENRQIVFVLQTNFKKYMYKKFGIDGIYKNPDDAYIIEKDGKIVVKILEKKAQNVEGSVEEKLWSAGYIKKAYQKMLGDDFQVEYAYCVNSFLKKKLTSDVKKYQHLLEMFKEDGIEIFYGEDEDYCEKLYAWINN